MVRLLADVRLSQKQYPSALYLYRMAIERAPDMRGLHHAIAAGLVAADQPFTDIAQYIGGLDAARLVRIERLRLRRQRAMQRWQLFVDGTGTGGEQEERR